MTRIRWILSNISVANVALAAVLIAFASYAFLPLFGKSVKRTLPAPKRQEAVPAAKSEKPVEGKSPSPSDYFIIAEQNIFHPERKIPVEKKEAVAPPPLPKPDFVLYGTLILDDMKIAYMEDKKAPIQSPTRGKKQIPLRVGEELSGFILKEIDTDKVTMVRGDERLVVQLNDASKSQAREGAAVASAAQAATFGQQTQPAPGHALQFAPQSPPPAASSAAANAGNPQPPPPQPPYSESLRRRLRRATQTN